MRRLEGQAVFVAGGAGRLGTATCQRLASEGARVFVTDFNAEAAREVAESIIAAGGEARAAYLDLADHGSIDAAYGEAEKAFGTILRLHCNGAALDIANSRDLNALDIDIDTWEMTLRINLTGHLACVRRALPAMIAAGDGAIVLTSSGASYSAEHIRLAYGVSKAGINQLVRHVAHNWGKAGVRCNAVAPGPILPDDFPQMDLYKMAMKSPRVGTGDDIGAMVAMLLSADAEWVNGQVIAVDSGMSMRG
jgi:NAD(P)-dependent dehydrogenase (short-subunit alcohol dehydrogenase family)